MENAYKNFMEKLDQEGLLPAQQKIQPAVTPVFGQKTQPATQPAHPAIIQEPLEQIEKVPQDEPAGNIFTSRPFGLTVAPQPEQIKSAARSLDYDELINDSTIIDGFDTDMFCDSRFKQIDDKVLYLKLKIARLQAELEEHKRITESAFLKSDKNHHQKLLHIQEKMEEQLKNLVADYHNQQLKSIVVSPFVKVFSYIKNYVALK